MGVLDNDDMRGAYVGQEVVCLDCLTDKQDTELKQDEVITEADLGNEDKTYFCDRCKKRL